ncbi:MAG: hypothetical protein HOD60_07170 [Candidatus Nitrosopelagicus sp.]|nr:hypothetical protein [Candidatus Nitrosopelagicus sp.]
MSPFIIIILALLVVLGLVILVIFSNESNTIMQSKLNEQENRLNQMEKQLQLQNDVSYCMSHIQTNDLDEAWYCFDKVIENPNYYFEPEVLEQYYETRNAELAQINSVNYGNCNLTDVQKMQINSLMNDDSITPSVKFSQMSMIHQSGCN